MRESLVIVPTYNEIDNLSTIVEKTLQAVPQINLLVVDDNSPDGTGLLADKLADKYKNQVHVLHRTKKDGLGKAYLEGFQWGINKGFNYLIEMDADGSHPPQAIPAMLRKISEGADVVIGSRYIRGGKTVNWPKYREFISKLGNTYSRLMLGTRTRDVTAGFRIYRKDFLNSIDLSQIESHGYCFQIDLTWRAIQSKKKIVEVPITFVERELGSSKMTGGIVREALYKVTVWGLKAKWDKLASLFLAKNKNGR